MKEFNKVIGYDDIKIELIRIVDMMLNPNKFSELGVKTTRGLILFGNPGVGKTLMANCLIKASKRKTFTIRKDLPDGEFVTHIKKTFEKAKKEAPSIVFLDDLDKFANEDSNHANAEEFVTIQSCIDDCKESEVFVLATANEDNCIPRSLLREGRFDKMIFVEPPKKEDAAKIIKHYLKNKKCSKNLDYNEIASLLDNRSCAALETVLNEAGVYAGYECRKEIEMNDIIRAFMRTIYGTSEKKQFNDNAYLKQTAYHEAGHAVVSELYERNSVRFLTVEPRRSEVGGFVHLVNNEDYYEDKKFMENRVVSLLAGKAAVEIVYGKTDVGSNSDVHRAVEIVKRFVDSYCSFGFSFFEGCTSGGVPSELLERKTIAVELEMERYYQQAKQILINNRKFLDNVANELAEKQVLLSSDIQRLREAN